MKRGYKRLLIFEIIVFIILILNSFVWNILNTFIMSLFLVCLLVVFKFLFGFEKDKHRYTKDLIMEVIIFLATFFIIYYLLGIIITFYKTPDYYTLNGITKFIIPTIMYIITREFLRYMVMCKSEGSKLLFITSTLVFVLMDIAAALYARNFSTNYSTFLFIALTLLPALSSNFVFSYFTTRIGYKPIIIYALIIGLYQYLLPIVPNPNEYLASIINFILPVAFGLKLYKFVNKDHERDIDSSYRKRNIVPFALVGAFVVVLVYFTSGYFQLWAIAVASDSMRPKIKKGDVVIVEKVKDPTTLKKGEVIAFRYEKIVVVHRLDEIVTDDGNYYFYTKGDANAKRDNFVLEKDKIIGKVEHKISYIGIPTVWLNELL